MTIIGGIDVLYYASLVTAKAKGTYMQAYSGPKPGTKLARVNELMRRREGATLDELNRETKQDAWSYKTNGTYLAKKWNVPHERRNGRSPAHSSPVQAVERTVQFEVIFKASLEVYR